MQTIICLPFYNIGIESNILEQLVGGDEKEAVAAVHVGMDGLHQTSL